MTRSNSRSSALPARRLAAQQIRRPWAGTPADVVRWLGAVQAQDQGAARWAVGLRLRGPEATDARVERAISEGAIIRTHALRMTWQLIAPEDVRWMVALVAPRLLARYTPRWRQLGLDAATFRRSHTVLEKTLRDGHPRTRAELAAALERVGIAPGGERLSHLLARAELEGMVCSGGRRGKQPTYALLDQRVPDRRPPPAREEALAELARRYFRSRGPATLGDFTWWSGLTAADVRAGLESVRSELSSEVIDGQTCWSGRQEGGGGGRVRAGRAAYLLPAFDEYLVAYRRREAVLDPGHARRVNAGGGMLGPCVVVDGRVAGTWRRMLGPTTVRVQTDLFQEASPAERRLIAAAGRRYAAFLGLTAEG